MCLWMTPKSDDLFDPIRVSFSGCRCKFLVWRCKFNSENAARVLESAARCKVDHAICFNLLMDEKSKASLLSDSRIA